MKQSNLTIDEVEHAIGAFGIEEQRRLLNDLPKLLKLSAEDIGLLKVAESAFRFWENPEDQIYDGL